MVLRLQALKAHKGFTLMEVLVVIALMAIVSVPIGASLIFGLKVYDTEVMVDRSFQKQQDVFLAVKQQVRLNPTEVQVVTSENGSSILEIGKDSEKTRYYQDGLKLYRLEDTVLTEVLSDVTSFNIENVVRSANDQLLSFTLELVCATNGRSQTLTADFALDRY